MGYILRFKSFEEAREADVQEYIVKSMAPRNMKTFFAMSVGGGPTVYYKPGVYRFSSFEEARRADMERMIKR